MRASSSMTRNVLVVPPQLGLDAAYEIMVKRRIRHLPVVQGGELVGILSDRDVLLVARPGPDGTPRLPRDPVAGAMSTGTITCEPTTSVRELVRVMTEQKIDAIPVLSGSGRLVGLVTSTDLLLLLLERDEARPLPFTFEVEEHAAYA
jgi:acetoin utilization protein AcuB